MQSRSAILAPLLQQYFWKGLRLSYFTIEGGRVLSGTVVPAGNKNEALPTLMVCLLTEEPVTLDRIPKIRDVLTVVEILQSIGVEAEWEADDKLTLCAKNLTTHILDESLCSKVRAAILFLGPLLARLGKIDLPLPGGDVIGARRIDTHFEGAQALGAKLEIGQHITGEVTELKGTDLILDEPSVTATENLILMSVLASGSTSIFNAASEPHVQGLCRLLCQMGANIDGIGTNRLIIKGVSSLKGTTYRLGADFMEVGSFMCLGAISGGRVKIDQVNPDDLKYTFKIFNRLGMKYSFDESSVTVDGTQKLQMAKDISGRIGTIYSGPWPAFNTDLMSVTIVAATQAEGTMIFFEKMFEGRMFFTDNLMSMGANIVLCDPHRIVVTGPAQLYANQMSSPDVRAGMALLIAANVAKGTSRIDNIYQIERGYYKIEEKLKQLGAAIIKTDS